MLTTHNVLPLSPSALAPHEYPVDAAFEIFLRYVGGMMSTRAEILSNSDSSRVSSSSTSEMSDSIAEISSMFARGTNDRPNQSQCPNHPHPPWGRAAVRGNPHRRLPRAGPL